MASELPRDVTIERLVNLTFAFLNLKRVGRSYLTLDWVVRNIEGYKYNAKGQERSQRTLEKLFERDRRTLSFAGVPIETVVMDNTVGYRLSDDDYRLPEVSFTPEEATVLALAGQMGQGDELATFTRSGWTKIAASGINRDVSITPQFTTVNDFATLSASTLDTILQAHNNHTRLSFMYQPHPAAEAVERWMDPWGLVSQRDRLYLVGHDLDRDEVRTFRITRISEVEPLDMDDETVASYGPFHKADPSVNLQELVDAQLRRGRLLVNATVRAIDPQRCAELIDGAVESNGDVYELVDVDKDWLVRTACAYAPHAVVLGPDDVVSAVVAQLRLAAKENS